MSPPIERRHDVPTPISPLTNRGWLGAYLPAPPTPFVGRRREVDAVCTLLSREGVRLVTLTGPGGVGKTRLALAVAQTLAAGFADGVAFVELAALRDPALVIPEIIRALGQRDPQDRSGIAALKSLLRDRGLLLVLDNVEQVLDAARDVAELVSACPRLKIVATSRSPLRLSGEQLVPIPPLVLPAPGRDDSLDDVLGAEAVQLFVGLARSVSAGFELTEATAPMAADICRMLDGLPLAIELAAYRLSHLSLDALRARLSQRLSLLTGGPRDLPARQRTLRDAIAWSYNLLAPDEQVLFRHLGIFVGGFTLDAAEAVGGQTGRRADGQTDSVSLLSVCPSVRLSVPPVPSVLDGVASLVEHGLIQLEPTSEWDARYRMLETIRAFATEQLRAHGDDDEIAWRHAAWSLHEAEAARTHFYTPIEPTAMDRLEVEYPNLRTALEWFERKDDGEAGLRLAAALAWFWHSRGPAREGADWFARLLSRGEDVNPTVRADALTGCGLLAWTIAEFERAAAVIAEAIDLWRDLGNRLGLIRALNFAALVANARHDAAAEHEAIAEAVALARAEGDPLWLALSVGSLGHTLARQGNPSGAIAALEEDLALLRTVGYERGMGWALEGLGDVALSTGDSDRACAYYREALSLSWKHRTHNTVMHELRRLAAALAAGGLQERAARLLGAVAALREAFGAAPTEEEAFGYDQQVDHLRAALGEARFTALRSAGRALPLDQAIAEALAAPAEPARPTRENGPSLSLRESEILPFLIAGKTDREIADALFIGRRTVETHVSHLLAKLGVPSRTAVAGAALAAGLIAPDAGHLDTR